MKPSTGPAMETLSWCTPWTGWAVPSRDTLNLIHDLAGCGAGSGTWPTWGSANCGYFGGKSRRLAYRLGFSWQGLADAPCSPGPLGGHSCGGYQRHCW